MIIFTRSALKSTYFIYFDRERERERERESRGGAERGRERIPSRLQAVTAELDAGLEPTNLKMMI